MDSDARIYVSGGQTLLGQALTELLRHRGYSAVVQGDPDLRDSRAVHPPIESEILFQDEFAILDDQDVVDVVIPTP